MDEETRKKETDNDWEEIPGQRMFYQIKGNTDYFSCNRCEVHSPHIIGERKVRRFSSAAEENISDYVGYFCPGVGAETRGRHPNKEYRMREKISPSSDIIKVGFRFDYWAPGTYEWRSVERIRLKGLIQLILSVYGKKTKFRIVKTGDAATP